MNLTLCAVCGRPLDAWTLRAGHPCGECGAPIHQAIAGWTGLYGPDGKKEEE